MLSDFINSFRDFDDVEPGSRPPMLSHMTFLVRGDVVDWTGHGPGIKCSGGFMAKAIDGELSLFNNVSLCLALSVVSIDFIEGEKL